MHEGSFTLGEMAPSVRRGYSEAMLWFAAHHMSPFDSARVVARQILRRLWLDQNLAWALAPIRNQQIKIITELGPAIYFEIIMTGIKMCTRQVLNIARIPEPVNENETLASDILL